MGTTVRGDLPGREPPPDRSTARREPHRGRALSLTILIGFSVLFLVGAAPRITEPFGDSHDGRNGAAWGLGSRAIREQGIIDSRAGARARMGDGLRVYANHPPLIASETAIAERICGERPWCTRAPAWLLSLSVPFLAYGLARATGIGRLAASGGVVLALASPMFLVYGAMLDTPVTALPFGLALLLLMQRHRSGQHDPAPLAGAAAFVAVLASWQGVLLVGLLTLPSVYAAVRRRPIDPYGHAVAIGYFAGLVVLVAWELWATGSLTGLGEQLRFRSYRDAPIGWGDFASKQWQHLRDVFSPVAIIALVPAVVALVRDRRTRLIGSVSVLLVCVYAVGLRNGAFYHVYWNYWLLVPLGLGLAVLLDGLVRQAAVRSYHPSFVGAAVVVVCAAVSLTSTAARTPARSDIELGWPAGRVAQKAAGPALGDSSVYIVAGLVYDPIFLSYYARLPVTTIETDRELHALARRRPEALVFTTAGPASGYDLVPARVAAERRVRRSP